MFEPSGVGGTFVRRRRSLSSGLPFYFVCFVGRRVVVWILVVPSEQQPRIKRSSRPHSPESPMERTAEWGYSPAMPEMFQRR